MNEKAAGIYVTGAQYECDGLLNDCFTTPLNLRRNTESSLKVSALVVSSYSVILNVTFSLL